MTKEAQPAGESVGEPDEDPGLDSETRRKTKLISVTQPKLLEAPGMTPEEFIVYCARVSNPGNQLNIETSPKLLAYLIKHGHWSPFEMANMAVEVTTSRAISAQIVRHWSFDGCDMGDFRFQEYSQRYSEIIGFEETKPRMAGSSNRQSSVGPATAGILGEWNKRAERRRALVLDDYEWALDNGIAKESARFGLTLDVQTTFMMNGNARSWIFFLRGRLASAAQEECREVALECADHFRTYFPLTYKLAVENRID